MAIYDAGTASLAADGTVTGVGTTWRQPLTLIRVGATMIFNTTPTSIVTIAEILSDTEIRVFNDKGFTAPEGTQYSILAHDGITVQGLAQDVAETLRFYQSRETEVAAAVDAFKDFDGEAFQNSVNQVNNQFQQISIDAAQVSSDRESSESSAASALSSSNSAGNYASQAQSAAESVSGALIGSFQGGVTVESPTQQVLNIVDGNAESYVWGGSLPVTVPENSTPASTGGISPGAWISVGDEKSRSLMMNAGVASAFPGVNAEQKFRNAVAFCNQNGIDLNCAGLGNFSITGVSDIVINDIGVDFSGLTVDVSGWSGKFIVQSATGYTTHSSSSQLVQDLVSGGVQSGTNLNGWATNTTADDSYLRIITSQPFFGYRGNVVNREEYNKHTRFGLLNSALKYDLDPSTITEIRVLKISKKWKTFGNVNFHVGDRDIAGQPEVIHVQYASLIRIADVRFTIGNITYTNGNPVLIAAWDSCQIKLENIYCQWPLYSTFGGSASYTYDISINLCYDVFMDNCDGIGDGWGATGNNSCQLIRIKNCKLSRIDFHQPFRELLHVTDTKIGDSGFAITALGDLIIDGDSEFVRSDKVTGIAGGYITTRSDTNGFCDGNLIIKGSRFTFDSETPHQLLRHFGDVNNPKPNGSPINYVFFNSIELDGLRNNYRGTLTLEPRVQSGVGISYPSNILIRNCTDGNFTLAANLNALSPSGNVSDDSLRNSAARSNLNIVIDNVKFLHSTRFELVDTIANKFRINLSMNRVYGTLGGKGISYLMNFAGVVSMHNCEIESFDSLTGGGLTKYLDVMISNSELRFQSRFSTYIIGGFVAGRSNIKIANSIIDIPTAGDVQTTTLIQCRLIGNTYVTPAGQTEMLKLQASGQTVNIGTAANIANTYVLEMGGTNRWASFRMPQFVNEISYIQQSAANSSAITRASSSTVFMSNTAGLAVAVWVS